MSGNVKNLIQNRGGLTPEQARENGRKGGLASGESRRKRRQMRDVLSSILTVDVQDEDLYQMLETAGLPTTHESAICYAAVVRAAHGDIEACRFVRDTLGEKPSVTMGIDLSNYTSLEQIDYNQLSDEELLAIAGYFDEKRTLQEGESITA